jgi:2,4-dienoyl-CoA reductase (NADPH2)
VTLLQRKSSRIGKLARADHRLDQAAGACRPSGVTFHPAADYAAITPAGLALATGAAPGLVPADTVVICAGQEPNRALARGAPRRRGGSVHLIGGADVAAELDAQRAIDQGTRFAARL